MELVRHFDKMVHLVAEAQDEALYVSGEAEDPASATALPAAVGEVRSD